MTMPTTGPVPIVERERDGRTATFLFISEYVGWPPKLLDSTSNSTLIAGMGPENLHYMTLSPN